MDNSELDRLVAKNVMGWVIHPRNTAHWIHKDDVDNVGYRPMAWIGEWEPTKINNQAIKVLEETERRLGCEISIQIHSSRHGMDRVWNGKQWQRKRYSVTISLGAITYDTPYCSFAVYGDSLGVAACEAALKAVENTVSDDELELPER